MEGATRAEANEHAIIAALEKYARNHGVDVNQLTVIGFKNADHGSSTAALSVSSAEMNPNGLPAFPWPKAEFPNLQYPFAKYEHQNKAEEDRCLQKVKDLIAAGKEANQHVAALIIEPMSGVA